MDKEEILNKSRKENKYHDEREIREMGNSFGFGGVVVAILCIVFSIIKAINGEAFYEFEVILFGYLAGIAWHNYRISKKNLYIISALTCTFAAIIGFLGYFLVK